MYVYGKCYLKNTAKSAQVSICSEAMNEIWKTIMASLLCIQYAIKIFFVNCGHYFLQYLVFLQNLSSPCVLCLERLRFNIFAQFRCVILFIIHSGLSKDEMLSTLRQKNYFLWRWEMAILGSCAIKGIKGALIADGYNVT